MPLALPYRFDTTTVFRGVMKGAAWLEAVVVVGIGKSAHARVYLVGKPGVPDILIARLPTEGTEAGQEIAAALGLPFEDQQVAY